MKSKNEAVNPWLVESREQPPGCQTCDGHDRVEEIKASTDVAWLRRVLAWPDNQLTVRMAAERRLRRLQRMGSRQDAKTRRGNDA
jgi:hypothetical protein